MDTKKNSDYSGIFAFLHEWDEDKPSKNEYSAETTVELCLVNIENGGNLKESGLVFIRTIKLSVFHCTFCFSLNFRLKYKGEIWTSLSYFYRKRGIDFSKAAPLT